MLDNEVNQNEIKVARRVPDSLAAPFECSSSSMAMPDTPKGGLIVKVGCAGVCYQEGTVRRGGFHPQLPGAEIAGTIHDVCNTLPNSNLIPGDKVILFPDESVSNRGFMEYIAVDDLSSIVQIPGDMPLEVAAMLPGSALTAFSAVTKAKPHVEKLLEVKSCVNILIVGAGGQGLWTVRLAQYLIGQNNNNIRIFMADNSIDKLLTAEEHGTYDIIHWNEEDHEQYIVERTSEACRGGVDVVIDFVSTPRTMHRALKVLNREGLVLLGGNAMQEVPINLNVLAAKQQSIVGIPAGSLRQLNEIVAGVAEGTIKPPSFSVFPVEEATQVIEDLSQSRITGRAILRFGTSTMTDNQ